MQHKAVLLIFTLALMVFVLPAMAQDEGHASQDEETEHHEHSDEDETLDVTGMIMHHIADNHSWHILDYTDEAGEEHAVSISLPVILWTDNGLVTFWSGAFHHDEAGHHVVESGEQRFVNYHGKIYYASEEANANGMYLEMHDGHPVNAKPLDFSITKNVFAMLVCALVLVLVFFSTARFYKRNGPVAPKGLAGFMEPLIVFVRDDIAKDNIGGKHYERFVPYLLTLFFFIWLNNILGLIPFFPGGANVTGNIAVTLVLAVFTLIIVNLNGNKSYWMHMLWMPGTPIWVRLMLAPIELVGVLTKPFALMIRLFANITAGHIVVLSLISLIFIFESVWVSPAAVLLTLFIDVLEILVGLLQAYIFTMLTALFIGMAMVEHSDH